MDNITVSVREILELNSLSSNSDEKIIVLG